jgi:tRNA (guanine-N7-)-methyltransferase
MARKNKLRKFAEVLEFPNVYENFYDGQVHLIGVGGQELPVTPGWLQQHFGNNNPVTLELACGGGEYANGLAQQFPNRNFLGVDIKGARIHKGARAALDAQLTNVAFLRTRIEMIGRFFQPGEIDEIWITFPDPFLRDSKVNRRLTAPIFLKWYRHILKPGRPVHLKTDSPELYQFTLETIAEDPACTLIYQSNDIYAGPLYTPELEIKTHYEQQHLAERKTIKYINFTI